MPIKKPKITALPTPFVDLEKSADDDQRRRALLMKRELSEGAGYSWNAERPGFWARFRERPKQRLLGAVLAGGMGLVLIGAFTIMGDTGIVAPERVVFFESWGGNRTAADAQADQDEAMDKLRAEVARNRAAVAAAEARAKALEAERAAAARASS